MSAGSEAREGGADRKADIGVTGLAVMGQNLARNLARRRRPRRRPAQPLAGNAAYSLVKEHGDEGTLIPSESMEGFVASLEQPRAIFVVIVQAGPPTDTVIDELVPLLDEGDIAVDCGNAYFMDTRRREHALREQGLNFVGCGVSGGEEGALNGPSIMPGGSKEAYAKLGPSWSRSRPRWTVRPAVRTWGRTVPGIL